MKQIIRDLKNTFVTHWAVGSDRANGREYLTSNLIAIILLTISVEFALYLALGDLYLLTDTSLAFTAPQAIMLAYETTGGFSIWLLALLVFQIYITVPLICLDWRRLHDFGWSGWNVLWIWLLEAIPYVVWLVTLFMFIKKSDPGINNYGRPLDNESLQDKLEEESAEASEEEF